MQFDTQGSRGILAGRITVSFRNWKRPHAAVGGVYRLRPSGAVKVTGSAPTRRSAGYRLRPSGAVRSGPCA